MSRRNPFNLNGIPEGLYAALNGHPDAIPPVDRSEEDELFEQMAEEEALYDDSWFTGEVD